MKAVISYKSTFDEEGYHYPQRVRISKDTFKQLADAILRERTRYKNETRYLTYLQELDLSKSIVYLTLTQAEFIKYRITDGWHRFMINRNTYLVIDEK